MKENFEGAGFSPLVSASHRKLAIVVCIYFLREGCFNKQYIGLLRVIGSIIHVKGTVIGCLILAEIPVVGISFTFANISVVCFVITMTGRNSLSL